MINKQELMGKLEDINEESHQCAIETWLEADRLEDIELQDEAENKREEASDEQAKYFLDLFDSELTDDEKEAVWQCVENDPDGFGEQFYQWYRE